MKRIGNMNDVFLQWGGPGWGMGPGMMDWGFGMGWFGMIIMAASWIAVILGIILLIRWLVVSPGTVGRTVRPEDSALEIIRKRYARDEINKGELEKEKRGLG
jgi:uncharacterized membrane protein